MRSSLLCLQRRLLFQRIRVHEHGGAEKLLLESFEPSELKKLLKPNEVLVRNTFAGVNFIDTYFRSGLYKKPHMPYTPGEEGAGAVVQLGSEALAPLLGQRVSYNGGGSGSYASFTVVHSKLLSRIPDGVTDEEAAAVPVQAFTAHYLTHDSYVCQPGSVVVVHAAAGGTGLLVCQMAKLRGATVIALCSGETKAALAASVGRADHVIDYAATHDWAAAVRHLAPEGVHVVYDGVGKDTFEGDLRILRRRGSLITFGNASGAVPPVEPLRLVGSIYLQRPKLVDFMVTPEERERRAADVYGWIQKKELKLTIGAVLPLKKAREAHELLEGRKTTGKVLLNCVD